MSGSALTWLPISIDSAGQHHNGEYAVDGLPPAAAIPVRWGQWQRIAPLGNSPAVNVARILLTQLVEEHRKEH